MVFVTFADLSVTLKVNRGMTGADMPLRDVINSFTKEWKPEQITLRGRPITEVDLDMPIGKLCGEHWITGDQQVQIEKHR